MVARGGGGGVWCDGGEMVEGYRREGGGDGGDVRGG